MNIGIPLHNEIFARRREGSLIPLAHADPNPTGASARSDAEIARFAQYALQWLTYLPKYRVKVSVENGWLTLSGDVDLPYQSRAAVAAVAHVKGVTGVSNALLVLSAPSAIGSSGPG
jgi:osmotically-inducible protein OsmY